MKSTIEEIEPTTSPKFPALYKYINNTPILSGLNLVVLFSGKKMGTVVYSDQPEHYLVGYYSESWGAGCGKTWWSEHWETFDGKIILEN